MKIIKKIFYKGLYLLKLNIVVYSIAKMFLKKTLKKDFTNEDVSEAWNVLNKLHKDIKSSAITENKINIEFDLQIIIPVYNVERYIEKCIDSVISQNTKYSYIVTIINDGSTDNSRNLLKRYENIPNIEIIDQKNRGLSGARNRGLENIKGKYITFVDSDDLLHPNAINSMLEAAKKYDADIVQGAFCRIAENDKLLYEDKSVNIVSEKDDTFLNGYPWGKLFRAELFKRIHFPLEYWFEDTINSYLIFPMSKTKVSIKDIVYNYRKNNASISFTSKGNPKVLDTLYITYAMLLDASKFEYFKTDEFYTKQYEQILINQSRISTLGNNEINKAAFIIQCNIIEKYFSSQKLLSYKKVYKELEYAIKTHNYNLFMLATNLLK